MKTSLNITIIALALSASFAAQAKTTFSPQLKQSICYMVAIGVGKSETITQAHAVAMNKGLTSMEVEKNMDLAKDMVLDMTAPFYGKANKQKAMRQVYKNGQCLDKI